jgi:aerobic-type carbon monoxide dehydrogenase small subunit (CoxS/CutS family)
MSGLHLETHVGLATLCEKHEDPFRAPAVERAIDGEEDCHVSLTLQVNGKSVVVDVDPGTPLLWVLRETLNLTGTKFGCGAAQCGACTVHVDGSAVRSCVLPVSAVSGRRITTIEGLGSEIGEVLTRAWIDEDVPQCGYCQTGQIMSAAVLFAENRAPSDQDIDACMAGNICRCATYVRIRRAIHHAADLLKGGRR